MALIRREISLDFTEIVVEQTLPAVALSEEESSYPACLSAETAVYEWIWQGISCVIGQSPFRNCNGYVQLPLGHKWRGKGYEDIPVEIHGGLTYSDGKWIGFDTAHAGDVWEGQSVMANFLPYNIPAYDTPRSEHEIDWNIERLVTETNSLAHQVWSAGIV